MANRTVYGKTHSENGWPMVDPGSCVWVKVPGTSVTLQIREGQPAAILGAFAADYNVHVEPLRDADSACFTWENSVATSNHLSATGADLNWNGPGGKRFRLGITKEQAYPGNSARMVDELIEFYEGMIFCGGEWSIRDWMHFQMGGNTYGSKNVDKVNDFIRRKIRADGFSTFKRSGTAPPPPPPPVNNTADILARAVGFGVDKAREVLPGVVNGLKQSEATNVNRIAMWLAQMGHESGSFKYTEEIASGSAYEGRGDLGNNQSGDGVRFKGRSWIQVTGRHNYSKLSQWAHSKGFVPTPTFFVDEPAKLAQIQFAGLGPAWYWTVARPQINSLSDQRNLSAVTQAINGGQNGAGDRKARYDRALALGDQLLALTSGTSTPATPGDDMAQVPQAEWNAVYQELTKRYKSRSPLRHLDEGYVETAVGFTLNIDAHTHVELVKTLAGYGHPETLALLREVAGADPVKYPDRADDANLAQAILAEVGQNRTARQDSTPAYRVVAPEPEAQAAPAPQQMSWIPPTVDANSTGQIIGQAYDALEKLQSSGVLNNSESAPLVSALIGVLQTKQEEKK